MVMNAANLNVVTALLAGVLSFASPCCLPLVPAYLSYITGVSVDQLSNAELSGRRRQITISALAFVIGLALIFTLLGATATVLGQTLLDYQDWIARIAGAMIIIFGLQT